MSSTPTTPHFRSTEVSKQLIVAGQPFLMLAGELQNSSMTSAAYMDTVWQNLVDTHLNTVLGCVTWDMIEPIEGQFNFTELDAVIHGARKHNLHLVLLWFGSFKNGLSTYAPSWVKTNPKRFPRAQVRERGGILKTTDVLSMFHPEARKADAKAFAELMAHIQRIDQDFSTILMVQVENETGLLGDSRDSCKAAEVAFSDPVPEALINFLTDDWHCLRNEFKANLSHFETRCSSKSSKPSGSWESVFGKGPATDEIFMAYHYALYLNEVAAAGKTVYPLPMYTNVWLSQSETDEEFPAVAGGGTIPGNYPSGGPTINVLDIWQRFAPSLDFISPDIYLSDYNATCANYRHRNQPLFVPEQRRDEYGARRIWCAFGSHGAIGTSPFGIDTLVPATNPFTKHYALLQSVSAIVLEAQRNPGSSVGFFFDELPEDGRVDRSSTIVRHWGGYEVVIERCFVFGNPGPGAGMVIHKGGSTFLLIGWGFQVRARALATESTFTGFLRFEEKEVINQQEGRLKTARMLNGDETRSGIYAMMPTEDPDYGGFPISVTIPARTMIAELELYSLNDEGLA